MRIRWARVGSAAVVAVLGPPVLLGSALWSTAPEPAVPDRAFPGPLECVTSEVLMGALPQHPDHGAEPTRDLQDEGAARALVAATRCRELGTFESEHMMQIFRLAQHGLAWMEANEDPALASEHALAVAELARDQQQVGGYLQVGIWQAVTEMAADDFELEALPVSELDWEVIRAWEEQELWSLAGPMLARPDLALWMAKGLVEVRLGRGQFLAMLQEDEQNRLD